MCVCVTSVLDLCACVCVALNQVIFVSNVCIGMIVDFL